MLKQLVVVGCLALASTAAAQTKTVLVESNGIEVTLPATWVTKTKGSVTTFAPKASKNNARAIEVIKLKAMPAMTVEGLQKELGKSFKVLAVKTDTRDSQIVMLAEAKALVGKDTLLDVDMIAFPVGTGAVALVSYTKADADSVIREDSIKILKSARVGGPKLVVEYTKPTKGKGPPADFVAAMTKVIASFDSSLLLPRRLPVKFENCGTVNAFYSPKGYIQMCHELYDDYIHLFTKYGPDPKNAVESARAATLFVFFHEFGHALAGELSLPITGKGEDAADELATLLTSKLGEPGQKAAMAAFDWFLIMSTNAKKAGYQYTFRDFVDEHSLDEQRMSSIVCLMYGGNQAKNEALAKALGFDARRFAKCKRDYAARYKAWNTLLEPHQRKKTKAK